MRRKPWPSRNHCSAHAKRCQATGAPGIEPGTSAFSLPRSVTQLGIEPMTTRKISVVALTTKLTGLLVLLKAGPALWCSAVEQPWPADQPPVAASPVPGRYATRASPTTTKYFPTPPGESRCCCFMPAGNNPPWENARAISLEFPGGGWLIGKFIWQGVVGGNTKAGTWAARRVAWGNPMAIWCCFLCP